MKVKKRGFKKGDVVRITDNDSSWYFNIGDLCTLVDFDGKDWKGDFNKLGNPTTHQRGVWYVGGRGGKPSAGAPYAFERIQ